MMEIEAAQRHHHQPLSATPSSVSSSASAHSGTPTPSASPPGRRLHLQPPPFATLASAGGSPRAFLGSAAATRGGGHVPSTPSPDSGLHSAYYSPSASPVQSRHGSGGGSGCAAASVTAVPLSRNNSDASQYSSASAAAVCGPLSPSRSFSSPAHSPVQHPRHHQPLSLPPMLGEATMSARGSPSMGDIAEDTQPSSLPVAVAHSLTPGASQAQAAGISRQQLINSPCPICGDKISGFHYGIFSCESCKGFFKRTVQNKKNYVCLRGAACPVSIATRKKCPACRFEKCLKTGMKLEAIREDRTRGGRSTYQCAYTLPAALVPQPQMGQRPQPSPPVPDACPSSAMHNEAQPAGVANTVSPQRPGEEVDEEEEEEEITGPDGVNQNGNDSLPQLATSGSRVPPLLQEIMDVEHLWFSRPIDTNNAESAPALRARKDSGNNNSEDDGESQNLTVMADKRLYKLVKWCKSLPLFKNILVR